MRKILSFAVFFTLLIIIPNIYAFWIWSPKTGQWRSSNSIRTPDLQLKDALEDFSNHKYKKALGEFRKIVRQFPDAYEAAEAQYYIGKCFEALKNPYRAYLEYNKLIEIYPNSKHIQEAVRAQFNIGKSFLEWKEKRILGVPLVLLSDHPSVEIFRKIVDTSPNSEYAPKALYELADFFEKRNRLDEAKEVLHKLIDNYPENELAKKARYKLAFIKSKILTETDYDLTEAEDAERDLKQLLTERGDSDSSALKASEELANLREKEAKKNFDIASFYEKQNRFKSAVIYYRIVMDKYPDTSFAELAKERIESLKGVVE